MLMERVNGILNEHFSVRDNDLALTLLNMIHTSCDPNEVHQKIQQVSFIYIGSLF